MEVTFFILLIVLLDRELTTYVDFSKSRNEIWKNIDYTCNNCYTSNITVITKRM